MHRDVVKIGERIPPKRGLGRDMPEVTLGERRSSTFRYKRKVRPLVESGTVPEDAHA